MNRKCAWDELPLNDFTLFCGIVYEGNQIILKTSKEILSKYRAMVHGNSRVELERKFERAKEIMDNALASGQKDFVIGAVLTVVVLRELFYSDKYVIVSEQALERHPRKSNMFDDARDDGAGAGTSNSSHYSIERPPMAGDDYIVCDWDELSETGDFTLNTAIRIDGVEVIMKTDKASLKQYYDLYSVMHRDNPVLLRMKFQSCQSKSVEDTEFEELIMMRYILTGLKFIVLTPDRAKEFDASAK